MIDSVENNIAGVSLDEILSKFESVRFLKIDVEGSEFPILLTSSLLGKVKEIVGEFHEYDKSEFSKLPSHCIINGYDEYTRNDLSKYLEKFGFKIELEESSWSSNHGFFRATK